MDCFYHSAVPSTGRCIDCGRSVCATCRSERGDCPGCRLGARIDAARPELSGDRRTASPPPPPPQAPRVTATTAVAAVRPETRALVALGYPFWPLALLALFDPSKSPLIRRHAWQALGFNAGMYGLWCMLSAIATIPILGLSAWPLLPFVVPVSIVASVIYGFKAFRGDDVHIPLVTEFIEQKIPV